MSKVNKNYIQFGNGTKDVNSQVIPANFSPSNYTPTQVASEGSDKISSNLNGIDIKIGQIVEANQREINTGFYSWGGSGSYYTLTGGALRLDRPGIGFIDNAKIAWTAPQTTATFSANTLNLIYIDSNGNIQSTTNRTPSLHEENIVLFEVLYDGTIYQVVKENHPVAFDTSVAGYLHNSVGTIIQGTGAVITKIGTGTGASVTDRQASLVGSDTLSDHGLQTTITDSAGSPISISYYYTDASGKWIRQSQASTIPMIYNNAGTVTTITSGDRGVFRVYASKDDLNSSTTTYIAVLHTAQFASLGNAQTAITNGVAQATNELLGLEIAQLGYLIVRNNASGGYIEQVQVSKDTLRASAIAQSAANTANLITTDTTTFNNNLSSSDTTVQAALETLDNLLFPVSSAGDINQTSFTLSNNIVTPNNVTGFAFSNASVRSFKAQVSVYINATSSMYEAFEILGIQKGSDWEIYTTSVGDSSGVTFSITSLGQIQYTNISHAGFVTGTIKFRALVTNL